MTEPVKADYGDVDSPVSDFFNDRPAQFIPPPIENDQRLECTVTLIDALKGYLHADGVYSGAVLKKMVEQQTNEGNTRRYYVTSDSRGLREVLKLIHICEKKRTTLMENQ